MRPPSSRCSESSGVVFSAASGVVVGASGVDMAILRSQVDRQRIAGGNDPPLSRNLRDSDGAHPYDDRPYSVGAAAVEAAGFPEILTPEAVLVA